MLSHCHSVLYASTFIVHHVAYSGYTYYILLFQRPFAGGANFCPNQLPDFSDEANIDVAVHEVLHALVHKLGW